MSYFIFEYLEKNRAQFEGMNFEDFRNNYQADDSLSTEVIEYARLNEAQIDLSNYTEELKRLLKANIAQQLYGPNQFEIILNEADPMLLKVLELEAAANSSEKEEEDYLFTLEAIFLDINNIPSKLKEHIPANMPNTATELSPTRMLSNSNFVALKIIKANDKAIKM